MSESNLNIVSTAINESVNKHLFLQQQYIPRAESEEQTDLSIANVRTIYRLDLLYNECPQGTLYLLRFENKTCSNLTNINVVVNLPHNIRTKCLSYFLLGQFVVPFKYIVSILGANSNKDCLANFVKDRIL